MNSLHARVAANRRMALVVALLALFMKALVPTGFMPEADSRGIIVQICSGTPGGQQLLEIAIPQSPEHGSGKHAGNDGVCAFAAIGHAAKPATDPIVAPTPFLAAAIAPLALAATLPVRRDGRYRPPLRGPPATA